MNRFTVSTRQVTTTTPAGRQTISTLDALGRVTEWRAGTLTSVQFVYDARGRLTDVIQGARRSTIAYDAGNRPTLLTDALSREVGLGYDASDRLITQTLPDSRRIDFAYDANGNISALTPPGRPTHRFSYTPVDLVATYPPPAVPGAGATVYEYDRDRNLTAVAWPDGTRVAFTYDGGGRVTDVAFAGGVVRYTYAPTGQVATVTTGAGVELAYTFDGPLPVGETWSGAVDATVTRTFTDRFFVASEGVSGTSAIAFGYDGDGLLKQAGALSSMRDGVGLPTATALGGVTDTTVYDGYGESARYTATATTGPLPLYDVQYQRDAIGRVTQRIEVIDGVLRVFGYAYDPAGRLAAVTRNGALEVAYAYDALGNLLRVVLPDGSEIAYLVDGRNRRVGKLVNGTFVKGWVCGDQLRPIAELDEEGDVVARFESVAGQGHIGDRNDAGWRASRQRNSRGFPGSIPRIRENVSRRGTSPSPLSGGGDRPRLARKRVIQASERARSS